MVISSRMMNSLIYLVIFSFIGSVAGLVGGVILLVKKGLTKGLVSISVPLAAGVLLSVSFLDLFPEAVEEIGNLAFTTVLFVFVLLFFVERFLFYLHHHQRESNSHQVLTHQEELVVPLVIFGDTIHNFLDGVAIGAAFLVNPPLGFLVSLSTFLHETPHEVADFGILLAKGWGRTRILVVNFFSALATFPGALLTYFFAGIPEKGVGILLSIASGFFLYVATTDFLPEAQHSIRSSPVRQVVFFVVGVLLIVLVGILFPEIGHF